MSVTLVTIRFSSSLIFTISSLKTKFHSNFPYRSIKVEPSPTNLDFLNKSCPRHSWSNLVEILSQSLATKCADKNAPYVKLPFYARHWKMGLIYKASGYKCFVLHGHMSPAGAFCTDFVTRPLSVDCCISRPFAPGTRFNLSTSNRPV
jgi:hypothetical protein